MTSDNYKFAIKLFKKYFDKDTIFVGIDRYLKTDKENIKVHENDQSDTYFLSFTIPLDDKIGLVLKFNAGKLIGIMRDDYPRYPGIKNGYDFKLLNTSTSLNISDQVRIELAYANKIDRFLTFLYFEFETWAIAIRKEGINSVSNGFLPSRQYKYVGRGKYEERNTNLSEIERISWEEFIEEGRRKHTPQKLLIDNKESGDRYKQQHSQPVVPFGCLVYLILGVGIIFSLTVLT